MEYDLIIIGGGAAGLMAAGTAASAGAKVVLLEKMEKPARKVRITGKGRCNLTNIRPVEEFLAKIQANREFFSPCLCGVRQQGTRKILREARGTALHRTGRTRIPQKRQGVGYRRSTRGVVSGGGRGDNLPCGRLRDTAARQPGARRQLQDEKGIPPTGGSPAVVLCTGGASYPATGSTGDGYALAHALGHTIDPVRPSLVPLETSMPDREFLYGLHLRNISAKLLLDGTAVAEEFGEMSFSPRGVEGAVVLRMSRTAVDALIEGHRVELSVDLKPALDEATCVNVSDGRPASSVRKPRWPTCCAGSSRKNW